MEKFYNFLAYFASLVKLPWKIIKAIGTLGIEYVERYFVYQRGLPDRAATGSFVLEILVVCAALAAINLYLGLLAATPMVLTFVVCCFFWMYRSGLKAARKRYGKNK